MFGEISNCKLTSIKTLKINITSPKSIVNYQKSSSTPKTKQKKKNKRKEKKGMTFDLFVLTGPKI